MPWRWLLMVLLLVAGLLGAWLLFDDALQPGVVTPAGPAPQQDGGSATAGAEATRQAHAASLAERRSITGRATGIAGRLLQSGRPLAGVELRAVREDGSKSEAGRCTSEGDGTFSLPLPAGRFRIDLGGAGVPRGYAWQGVALVHGQHRDLGELAVPAAATITGRVVDEQGEPIAGARVHGHSDRSVHTEWSIYDVDVDSPAADPNVRTGSDGRFAIGNLLAGKLSALAEHPDHQPRSGSVDVEAGGSGDAGDVVLRAAAALRGFVFDQLGAPVAGASVTPGGGHSYPLRPRQAVATGPDGGFVLRGFSHCEVSVERAGFATQLCEPGNEPQPMRIVLSPEVVLAGTVAGTAGRPGTLHISTKDFGLFPGWVWKVLYEPQPIAADGTFRICLPAGTWSLRASIPGAGSVPPRAVQLPLPGPLVLDLVPDVAMTVHVVDDLGAPVPGALLARVESDDAPEVPLRNPVGYGSSWFSFGARHEQTTDGNGMAVVHVPAHVNLMLAATAPGHLFTAIAARQGSVPALARLVLPRGGAMHGRLVDASLTAHAAVIVSCVEAGQDDQYRTIMRVDQSGSFRSPRLQPGSYRVTVQLEDLRSRDRDVPVPDPLPVFTDWDVKPEPMLVTIAAGEDLALELAAPLCGEVQGRVLAAGQPVPSAIVFASNPANQLRMLRGDPPNLDAIEAHELNPHCRTDRAGRFRFLVAAAGTCELRARHPRSAAWCEPVVLQVSPQGRIERNIVLHTAEVRGSFDISAVPPGKREFCSAQLYRLQDAACDPFFFPEWGSSQEYQVQRLPLGNTGTFAFECLPPGGYVLRIVGMGKNLLRAMDNIVVTRVLEVSGDTVVDLGRLEAPVGVKPKLRCGLQPGFAFWVRQAVAGSDGVFVCTVISDHDGAFACGELPVGRYRLQAFRAGYYGGLGGVSGEPAGEPVDVEVHADGSCTPDVVWPQGVRQ